MKERPILFSAPMVRAILDGRKTQTRRVLKPQPNMEPFGDHNGALLCWKNMIMSNSRDLIIAECPYGQPGDRLWVRENLEASQHGLHYAADNTPVIHELADALNEKYASDYYIVECRTIPSIHMPRWASRITLEIVSVRVERLNKISGMDARREGISIPAHLPEDGADLDYCRREFPKLWESINGDGSWNQNPWVWVVEFKVAHP